MQRAAQGRRTWAGVLGLAAVLLAVALPAPASASAPTPTYAETRVLAFELQTPAGVGAERGSSPTGTGASAAPYDELAVGYPLVPRGGGRFRLNERVAAQLDDRRLGRLTGQLDETRLNQLVEAPGAQRFLDANTGNINIIQEVDGQLLRITIAADKFEIISVGPIRARNVTNSVSSGRFVPIGGGTQ